MPDKKENSKIKTLILRLDRHEIALFAATICGYCVWNLTYLMNARHVPWDGALPSYILFMLTCGAIATTFAPKKVETIFIGTLIGQLAATYFSSNNLQGVYIHTAVGSLAVVPGIMLGSAIHDNYITEESRTIRKWVQGSKHGLQLLIIATVFVYFPRLIFGVFSEASFSVIDSETKEPLSDVHVVYRIYVQAGAYHGHSAERSLSIRELKTGEDGKVTFPSILLFQNYFGWNTIHYGPQVFIYKKGYLPRGNWYTGRATMPMARVSWFKKGEFELRRSKTNDEFIKYLESSGETFSQVLREDYVCSFEGMKNTIEALDESIPENIRKTLPKYGYSYITTESAKYLCDR